MDMIFATSYTRSLYKSGALKYLLSEVERYNKANLAAQETRWKGNGTFDTRNHTVFHKCGVAFKVNKRLKESVLNFKPINKRICLQRLKTKCFKLSIINFHTETEDKDEITKETVFLKLKQVFDTIPTNYIKI
ncbi:hypothetical protein J437_LFUL012583, partial [Ladona fulva]